MTVRSRLATLTVGRPYLVALATLNALFGIAAAWILVPLTLGLDAANYRNGVLGIQEGVYLPHFLYAPPVALLMTPLTWVSASTAALLMSGIGLVLVAIGLHLETRGCDAVDRALTAVAVLGFVPLVYELITGQVTLILAAGIFPMRDRRDWRAGVLFGLVAALLPKPMLAPLAIWMLIRRPRAFVAAMVTGLVTTLIGVVLMGPDLYRGWLQALFLTGEIVRPGNLSVTSIQPAAVAGILAVATVVLTAWALLSDERRGFVAALIAGLLLAPYTQFYALTILLIAVKPALAVAPRATRALAFVANPALLVSFATWAAAALAAIVPWRVASRPPREQQA
jgi:hypothetical protein